MRRPGQLFIRTQMIALAALLAAALAPLTAHAWTYKIAHSFCSLRFCVDGDDPRATPSAVADPSDYFGTTVGGGPYKAGSIYELRYNALKDHWKAKSLYTFCESVCPQGYLPEGTLVEDVQGDLYGTTFAGGSNNQGVIFELDRSARKPELRVLYNFAGTYPEPDLTYAGAANGAPYDGSSPLYGADGNVVYELTRNGSEWVYSAAYTFPVGEVPYGLVFDVAGNLFGALGGGGDYGKGAIFKLTFSEGQWTPNILHSFCARKGCADGQYPSAPAFDSAGNIFGVTYSGGTREKGCCGTIFELTPNGTGWDFVNIYNFCALRDCKDGANPSGPLLIDGTGSLFGVTRFGGGHDNDSGNEGGGTLFQWSAGTLTTLYRFCSRHFCQDGEYPTGGLRADAAGHILGVTEAGGSSNSGTVFELSP